MIIRWSKNQKYLSLTVLPLAIFFIFFACQEDPFSEPAPQNPLQLSSYEVMMGEGALHSEKVIKGNAVSVKSSDSSVVIASLSGNEISLYAISSGHANVLIFSANQQFRKAIRISVTKYPIGVDISDSSLIFWPCNKIPSSGKINISPKIKEIEEGAFFGCKTLTALQISESVSSIGHYAFVGCTNLSRVDLLSATPPKIEHLSFDFETNANLSFYIPRGSKQTYLSAAVWSENLDSLRVFEREK